MTIEYFWEIYEALQGRGYQQEIDWSENLKPCDNAKDFFREYMWVVVNAGMKNQIAAKIFERIIGAIKMAMPLENVFGHKGKVRAIYQVMLERERYFAGYQKATDKLAYLATLPWIGSITKYHLAKNLGGDVVKPDRHLVRIAKQYGLDCTEMCRRIAEQTGFRLATVDLVIWRAANLGLI